MKEQTFGLLVIINTSIRPSKLERLFKFNSAVFRQWNEQFNGGRLLIVSPSFLIFFLSKQPFSPHVPMSNNVEMPNSLSTLELSFHPSNDYHEIESKNKSLNG